MERAAPRIDTRVVPTNDSEATADWGWQPDYDVNKMTKEMLKDLKEMEKK